MDRKLSRLRKNQHLAKLLEWRETRCEASKVFKSRSQFCNQLIQRLGLEAELDGHRGCVNCLEWSPNGLHLASGSDDTNVILWDPFRHKQLQVIPTPHMGNIFSVKFIGDESVIATAAGDCRVIVQSVQGAVDKAVPLLDCACHIARVKRLATSPDQPNLFWSAGEEGLVLQFDMREPHECPAQSKALLDLTFRSELKCIAVNPTRSHLIAVGANDCFVRLYDRRMIKPTPLKTQITFNPSKRSPPPPTSSDCVQYYAAGHLAKENASIISLKWAVTYVAFNRAGTELLANIGGEQIYLFDINNSRHINELRIPQSLPKKEQTSQKKCCHTDKTNGFSSNNLSENNDDCACLYMKRALKAFRREWKSDLYGAARDYLHVIQTWPDHKPAYIGLIKCLISLKWEDEADVWYKYLVKQFPDCESSAQVKTVLENLNLLKVSTNGHHQNEEAGIKKVEDCERDIRLDSYDYEKRYLGHCNTTTDIKEANFLGENGDYICAGSDEGIIFIWDKESMEIVRALNGDNSIVNCIQPHPSACLMASSGIDSEVKVWSPLPENRENTRIVQHVSTVVEDNQKRMCMDPFESMLANMGYQIQGGPMAGPTVSVSEVAACRAS